MPEAKPEAKSDKQQQIKEILAGIESGIQNLFQSDQYRLYLQTMAKFHRYSLNNTILIFQQRPDATHCQFGRYVRKGEKGIRILAPAPIKKTIQVKKLDPVTQAPVRDAHGAEVMEDRTIQIPRFKVVTIFDISQTEGPPLPEISADLAGDVEHYEAFMEALQRTSPVPIEIKPLQRDVDGFFSRDAQSIALREGMSQIQTVCAAVHEVVHSILHNEEDSEGKSRASKEVEAESVAMAVSSYFHIDTSANSIPYLTTWSSDKTLPELRASLETITKTTSTLISDRSMQRVGDCSHPAGAEQTGTE